MTVRRPARFRAGRWLLAVLYVLTLVTASFVPPVSAVPAGPMAATMQAGCEDGCCAEGVGDEQCPVQGCADLCALPCVGGSVLAALPCSSAILAAAAHPHPFPPWRDTAGSGLTPEPGRTPPRFLA